MNKINSGIIKELYQPPKQSHKGQNGRLTIIGGSKLFHGASLWALKTASRIVDMVFYATVKENQQLAQQVKGKLYDFICIPQTKISDYIAKSDAVLIGPGMVRGNKDYVGTGESSQETRKLVKKLLSQFPHKKWIIDAGALQVMDPEWLKSLKEVIITPHFKEFVNLFKIQPFGSDIRRGSSGSVLTTKKLSRLVAQKAREYNCVVVLKGPTDIVCSAQKCVYNITGNEGMTKGGTGDVLAGLITGLACKNDLFLAASAGVYINGLAGDSLYQKVGPYFNASDLCDQIPTTLKELIK